MAEVIAHELAHMWFGDLVTMAWWDDLWLNEAFATWMAFRVIDSWHPEWRMWLDFEHLRTAAYALDGLRNTHPIYARVDSPEEATENFDAITYEKGASVVRMLERWLGPQAFQRGVRRYIRAHRESNACAADLWEALEKSSGQPVAPVMRAWIEKPGFPLVSVRWRNRNGRAWLDVEQERFFADPTTPGKDRRTQWPIPAVLRIHRNKGRDRIARTLLRGARDRIALGASREIRWVYANAQESGFYRPLHDSALIESIAEDFFRLTPAERMGFVGHQWAGVRSGRAPLADFLALIERLAKEPEPEVLEAATGPLYWLVDQVIPGLERDGQTRFRPWLVEVFGAAFRQQGWQPDKNEPDSSRLQRAALLRIVGGLAKDPEIQKETAAWIERYLKKRSSLEANLAGPVVEIAAHNGDARLYDRYLQAMHRGRTPQERTRFEMALAGFRRVTLIRRTLRLTLEDDIPTQDVVLVLGRLLANPVAREPTWKFIRQRWRKLSARISPGLASRLVTALPALQTRAHRKEVEKFFEEHPLPTATRTLQQTLERFDLNASLRNRVKPELRRWLLHRSRRGPAA